MKRERSASPRAGLQVERVENRILTLRGQRIIVDADLAAIYGVPTKRVNEQVKRNKDRFPEDFMFQLSKGEFKNLRSQIATSSWGGQRKLPYAFTEHGAIMAANVLNSAAAVRASVYVVRAFIKMREILGASAALSAKLAQLEERVDGHDEAIVEMIRAIRRLMAPVPAPKRRIGFRG